MQTKCIKCDGLGYYHSLETFRSEHCPECQGKGVIEVIETIDVPEMPLVVEEPVVVEAPKPKKSAKAKPVVDEPQADEIATDGQPE